MFVAADSLADDIALDGDVCIVGAGTAGLPLAVELEKSGLRVIVLEGGGYHAAESSAITGSDPASSYGSKGWIASVGGTSRFWGGRLVEYGDDDFRFWPSATRPWPTATTKAEGQRAAVARLFGFPTAAFDAGTPPGAPKSSDAVSVASPMIVGRKRRELSGLGAVLKSSSQSTLCTHARVVDFQFQRGSNRLQSVRATAPGGASITANAKRFVFACGALETTRLLLWLEAASGRHLWPAAAGLGKGLQDHVGYTVGTVRTYDPAFLSMALGLHRHQGMRRALHFGSRPDAHGGPRAYLNFQLTQSTPERLARVRLAAIGGSSLQGLRRLANLAMRPGDTGTALGMAAWTLSGTRVRVLGSTEITAQIAIEQTPSHNNAIRLSHSVDPNGVPKMNISWQAGVADDQMLAQCRTAYATYWHAMALNQTCEIEWTEPTKIPPGYDLHHPCGTVAIGQHSNSSIVDTELTCHAVPNLSVLSTAVFPRAGSGNPTLTLLKLGFRLAEHIAQQKTLSAPLEVS